MITAKKRRRLGLKRKKPKETRAVRANLRNRNYQQIAREIKRREFREEFKVKFLEKYVGKGEIPRMIRKALKQSLWILEGNKYA